MQRNVIGALVAVVFMSACLGNDAASDTVVDPRPAGPAGLIQWDEPDHVANLGGGWTVRACDGLGSFMCVERDGLQVGTLERTTFSVSIESLFPAADAAPNLADLADGFHEAIESDQADKCPADYVFEKLGPDSFVFAGSPGIFYGFVGMLADGAPSDMNLQYATIIGSQVISVTAGAYDGGCLGRGGLSTLSTWDSMTLSEFRPFLEAALHDSPLPTSGR